MPATYTEHCAECGGPLEYRTEGRRLECGRCGRIEWGYVGCPAGHFLCDECHGRSALDAIETTLFGSASQDPFEIAEQAMALPGLPELGCHHAHIAAGALMAALKNAGHPGASDASVREVLRRTAAQARGGFCGLTGVCGVLPAIGACVSVLAGSKCGTDVEQRLTMEAVTRVSGALTELTGPSCCRAYVRAALETANAFLAEKMDVALAAPAAPSRVACDRADKHPHRCREDACPYYPTERAPRGSSAAPQRGSQ